MGSVSVMKEAILDIWDEEADISYPIINTSQLSSNKFHLSDIYLQRETIIRIGTFD